MSLCVKSVLRVYQWASPGGMICTRISEYQTDILFKQPPSGV